MRILPRSLMMKVMMRVLRIKAMVVAISHPKSRHMTSRNWKMQISPARALAKS